MMLKREREVLFGCKNKLRHFGSVLAFTCFYLSRFCHMASYIASVDLFCMEGKGLVTHCDPHINCCHIGISAGV